MVPILVFRFNATSDARIISEWLGRTSSSLVVATDSVGTQFNGLTVSTTGVTANQSKVLVNSLGEVSDQYAAGDFTGIRSFALRFTTVPTSTTNVFLQNSQSGQ